MRRSLGIAVLLAAWAAPCVTRAAEDRSATPALAGESSRIKPAAERQLGGYHLAIVARHPGSQVASGTSNLVIRPRGQAFRRP